MKGTKEKVLPVFHNVARGFITVGITPPAELQSLFKEDNGPAPGRELNGAPVRGQLAVNTTGSARGPRKA